MALVELVDAVVGGVNGGLGFLQLLLDLREGLGDALEVFLALGEVAAGGTVLVVEFLAFELVEARAEVLAQFDLEDGFARLCFAAGGGGFGVLPTEILDCGAEVLELGLLVAGQGFLELGGDFCFMRVLLFGQGFHIALDIGFGALFGTERILHILKAGRLAAQLLPKRTVAVLLLGSLLLDLL